jgi:hypothetical protein
LGWLIVALGAGVGLGVLMPKAVQRSGNVIRVLLSTLVAVLLFIMGLKIGGNREVLSVLPSLGLKALVLGGIPLGLSVLALWLWIRLRGRSH